MSKGLNWFLPRWHIEFTFLWHTSALPTIKITKLLTTCSWKPSYGKDGLSILHRNRRILCSMLLLLCHAVIGLWIFQLLKSWDRMVWTFRKRNRRHLPKWWEPGCQKSWITNFVMLNLKYAEATKGKNDTNNLLLRCGLQHTLWTFPGHWIWKRPDESELAQQHYFSKPQKTNVEAWHCWLLVHSKPNLFTQKVKSIFAVHWNLSFLLLIFF